MTPAAWAAGLGCEPSDGRLLEQALTHSSWVHEHPDAASPSNERLEYLGDAVLSLVIAEALWEMHPDDPEGLLTMRRAAIVSDRTLASIARRIGVGPHLRLGLGAERAGERERGSVIASALEALVAAVYLDRGLPAARTFVRRVAASELAADLPTVGLRPAKARLQELATQQGERPPHYRLLAVSGPDHARTYSVEAVVGERVVGAGTAGSRRAAESIAAEEALALLAAETPDAADAPGGLPDEAEG
ncbi:MAG: ribonuclease III [Chloroflexota bacterium]